MSQILHTYVCVYAERYEISLEEDLRKYATFVLKGKGMLSILTKLCL